MTSKEIYDFRVKNGLAGPDEDLDKVASLVDGLIAALYKPVMGEVEFKGDNERCNQFGIAEEPINWGDLKCIEVTRDGEVYQVLIDEAGPDQCPTFCNYIERFMESWGWICEVRTEW